MSENPIVPKEIRTIFHGRVFSVRLETIPLPKGGELQAEIIRHPGSVVIIPLTAQNEIILVRQYRYAVDRWLWELPAGSVDRGETPETAATRECAEEIRLRPETLERLGALYPTPGYCDELMVFFRLRDLATLGSTDPETHLDPDEDLEVCRFRLDEIRDLIQTGEIQDMKTIVGFGLWASGSGLQAEPETSNPTPKT